MLTDWRSAGRVLVATCRQHAAAINWQVFCRASDSPLSVHRLVSCTSLTTRPVSSHSRHCRDTHTRTRTRTRTHTHTDTHTHTHNRLTGLPGWARNRRNIHTHPDHQTSFINFLHLLRFIASSLFNVRAWQSFSTTSLQALFGLPLGLTLYFILHTFLHPIVSFFRNTCLYNCSLFCWSTNVMSSIPNLSHCRHRLHENSMQHLTSSQMPANKL